MSKRNYGLDIIKIFATILIVFHHYQQITGAVFNRINFYNGRFPFGYIVELFFVISGYVIAPYIDKVLKDNLSMKEFLKKRFARLFPLVIISAIVYEVLIYIYILGQSWFGIQPTLWGTVIDSLMIQCGWGFANPMVNNPTWYLSVLMLCYSLFYFAIRLADKFKFQVNYIFILLIFVGASIDTYKINLPLINQDSCRGLYSFFWGVILYSIMKLIQKKIDKHKVSVVIMLAMIIIGIPLLSHYENILVEESINYILTFIYYTTLIVLVEMPMLKRLFDHKFIGTLSKISFDVYIWHNPLFLVLYIIIAYNNWSTSFLFSYKSMFIYTIVAFGIGVLSYYMIEMPIRKKILKAGKVSE